MERNYIFGMGDNRDNSLDGRFWGFIPEENIVGTPMIVYWSWDPDIPLTNVIGEARIHPPRPDRNAHQVDMTGARRGTARAFSVAPVHGIGRSPRSRSGSRLCVKIFVLDAVQIPSRSMEQALHAGDFVLVNKLAVRPCDARRISRVTSDPLPHFRLPRAARRPGRAT